MLQTILSGSGVQYYFYEYFRVNITIFLLRERYFNGTIFCMYHNFIILKMGPFKLLSI